MCRDEGITVVTNAKISLVKGTSGEWIGFLGSCDGDELSLEGTHLLSFGDSLEISKHLRDPNSGRLDAQKIAALMGISITNLATKVCGVTKQALSQGPTSGGIQGKLQPLEDVAMGLLWCGGDGAKFRAWLNRPNRDFPLVKGKTPSPLDLILSGHAAIVASKVHQLRTGHPA
jgi:hypothetical protein